MDGDGSKGVLIERVEEIVKEFIGKELFRKKLVGYILKWESGERRKVCKYL